MDKLGDGRVADEQVVVAALKLTTAHRECRGLSAEKRGDLEYLGIVACSRKVIGGGQAGHSATYDPDSHVPPPAGELAVGAPAGSTGGADGSRASWRRFRFCFQRMASPTTLTGSHRATKWTTRA